MCKSNDRLKSNHIEYDRVFKMYIKLMMAYCEGDHVFLSNTILSFSFVCILVFIPLLCIQFSIALVRYRQWLGLSPNLAIYASTSLFTGRNKAFRGYHDYFFNFYLANIVYQCTSHSGLFATTSVGIDK